MKNSLLSLSLSLSLSLAPLARAQVSIAWPDVDKTTASLADLPTRNFADLQNTATVSPNFAGVTLTGNAFVGSAVGSPLLRASAFSLGGPAISFSGDDDTGLFRSAENTVQVVTGAVARITVSPSEVSIGTTGGLKVLGTTASTSTTTGAVTVAGGVGVAGAVNAGAGFGLPAGTEITNISAGGGITFNATTTAMRAPGQPSDQFVLGVGTVSVGAGSTFIVGANKLKHSNGVTWSSGTGSPEGIVTAPVGSLYSRTDGAAGTSLYVKESGIAATGWIAK